MMTARIASGEPCSEVERRIYTQEALDSIENLLEDSCGHRINMDDQDLSRLLEGWQGSIT